MNILKMAAAATILILSTSVNAALVGRLAATPGGTDYQAYYDDVADLTWLADANAAGPDLNWAEANIWAAGLTVSGVDGWRLPDTIQPDASCSTQNSEGSYGINCTGSEMGDLFYNVLGNSAGSLTNTGPFSNLRLDYYWSATEYAPIPISAWLFRMSDGFQGFGYKVSGFSTWAVQSGDVGAVPVPAAVWLLGSGLVGLVGFARRKNI